MQCLGHQRAYVKLGDEQLYFSWKRRWVSGSRTAVEQMEILRAQFEHLLAVVFPLVLLSVPSRLLDQYSVSFVLHVD